MKAQGTATSMKFLRVQRSPPSERHNASPCTPCNENAGESFAELFLVSEVTQTTCVCAALNGVSVYGVRWKQGPDQGRHCNCSNLGPLKPLFLQS